MSYNYKYNGHPAPGLTANISGAGSLISAPGAGRYIEIHDVLASESTTLRTNTVTGDILIYVPVGSSNLSASITGGVNNSIFSTAGNVTVTYSNVMDI